MDRVQSCGDSERIEVAMVELGGSEPQGCDPSTKQLSECLRRIGDELDGNIELQRMIEQVQMYPPKEVFFRVAAEMFSDGTFNWGRVVALFYFACKLILKVSEQPSLTFCLSLPLRPSNNLTHLSFSSVAPGQAVCTKLPELIRTIISWTMEYIQLHVLSWIQAQGGWEGLLSYFGTPTWQTIAVFAAGILTASLTFWKMS
uniref:BCL2 associated X, apoptosis regulator n=1 Tax=Varanus komodoensis TaxID=61221 RepID=A0A8D2LKC6_VARKO